MDLADQVRDRLAELSLWDEPYLSFDPDEECAETTVVFDHMDLPYFGHLLDGQVAISIPGGPKVYNQLPVYDAVKLLDCLSSAGPGEFITEDCEIDWVAVGERIFDALVHEPMAAGAIA
jgi:hypothetical protein